jgi:hypothetical protein
MADCFKNFQAAARKPNMKYFGMFPQDRDLSWIANNPCPVEAVFDANVFDENVFETGSNDCGCC